MSKKQKKMKQKKIINQNSLEAFKKTTPERPSVREQIKSLLLEGGKSKNSLMLLTGKSHSTITSALSHLQDLGEIEVIGKVEQNGLNVNLYGIVESHLLKFALADLRRQTRVYNALVTLRNNICFSDKPRGLSESEFDSVLNEMLEKAKSSIEHIKRYIVNLKAKKPYETSEYKTLPERMREAADRIKLNLD